MSETEVAATDQASTPEVAEKPMESAGKVFDEAYVKSLREEAAAARIAKKDAVEAARAELKAEYESQLADRDTAYTELQNQLGSAWIELEKLYTTIDAGVPSDKVRQFVAILQGTDKDSIAESVKSGIDLVGGFNQKSPAIDPTRGTGGRGELPLNGDPILNAIKSAVGVK